MFCVLCCTALLSVAVGCGEGETGGEGGENGGESSENEGESELADSVDGDHAALIDLYDATGGDGWDDSENWGGEPSTLDSWAGVDADDDGRVTRLDLFDNGLTGELPEELGNLARLQYINLKQNELTGEIPSTIGTWNDIEVLLLSGVDDPKDYVERANHAQHPGKSDESGNDFSGAFPDVWGEFSKLRVVEISGSSLNPILHESIGACEQLLQIHINWNENYTEPLPSALGDCTTLQKIYMSRNRLSGELPASFSNLTDLRTFHVGANENLEGPIPDLSGATEMRNFHVDSNELSGPFPDYTVDGTWFDIIGTSYSWNNLHSEQLPEFDAWNHKIFTISGNDIGGTIPESFWNAESMINTNFGWTDIGGTFPEDLTHMTDLRNLRMPSTNVEGPWPELDWDNPSLSRVQFSDARFVFRDMLRMVEDPDDSSQETMLFTIYEELGLSAFWYDSQQSFGQPEDLSVAAGENVSFDGFEGVVSHPDNNYQWEKDDEPLTDANGVVLALEDVASSDAGTYVLTVTNSNVPELTLESQPVTVAVD